MSNDNDALEAEELFDNAEKLIESGNDAEAEKVLKQVIGKNPGFTYAYQLIAEIRGRANRYDDALKALDLCLRSDPGYAHALYLSAKYLFRAGKKEESLAYLEKALRINPTNKLYLKAKKSLI